MNAAVTEQDLELLEEYLDEALAPDVVDALRARLADEPGLAAALAELRGERAARAAAWRSLEPGDADAARFAARVSSTARRQDLRSRVFGMTRYAGAAAACLLMGVFLGWVGRERGDVATPFNGPSGSAFVDGGAPGAGGGPGVTRVGAGIAVTPPTDALPDLSITEIRYDTPRGPMPMLLVSRVVPGTPGASTGLREGDLVLSVDNMPVRDVRSLAAALSARSGVRVLRIVRDNTVRDLRVQVQQR